MFKKQKMEHYIDSVHSAVGLYGVLFISFATLAVLVSWVAFFFIPLSTFAIAMMKIGLTTAFFGMLFLLLRFIVREQRARKTNAMVYEAVVGMLNRTEYRPLLNSIVQMVADVSGVPDCFIFLYDRKTDRMVRRFGAGLHAGLPIDVQSYGRGEAVVGTVWENGSTLYVEDYQVWPKRDPDSCFSRLRSILGVPIKRGSGEVVGVIGLTHLDHTGTFSPETIDVLERSSSLLAVILDNFFLLEQIREREVRFRQLAENIEEVFWLRTHRNVLYMSPTYEKVWGRSCASFYQSPHSFSDAIHPEDRTRMDKVFESELYREKGLYDEEYRIIRPDGSERWVWVRTFSVPGAEPDLRAGIAVDITDRKYSEQQLRQSEENYRKLSEQMLREIRLAARVQRAIIPHGAEFDALSVRTIYSPYQEVSGDLFGYKWIQNKQRFRGFVIDVTGHGISTAFHAAAMNVLFHQELERETGLIESLRSINRQASLYFAEGCFAAAVCFEFDFKAGCLRYASAGIPYLLMSAGDYEGWRELPGSIIGVCEEPEFFEQTVAISSGDTFYFMTDGLQEPAKEADLGNLRDFSAVLNRLADIQRVPVVHDDVSALCIKIK